MAGLKKKTDPVPLFFGTPLLKRPGHVDHLEELLQINFVYIHNLALLGI